MTRAPLGGRLALHLVLLILLVLSLGGCASNEKRWRRAAQYEQRGEYAQYEQRGEYAAALSEYEELTLRLDAGDHRKLAEAYVKAGECYWHLDRPNEAVKAFARATAVDPANLAARLRAAELYVSEAPERAFEQVKLVLAADPRNAEALSVLGAAYSSAGQLPMARVAYQRSLEIEPGRVSVAVTLADLQYRDLDTKGARATLHQAASAAPKSPMPWLALGRLEEHEGNAEGAEEAYRNALAADDSAETNLRLAQFLQRNARIDEAEKILKRADALQPWLPTALPDFEFKSGRVMHAIQAYTSALQPGQLPSDPGAARSQRGLLAARVVEADLSLAVPDAAKLARRHLDQYRDDVDPVTAQVLQAEIFLAESDLGNAYTAASTAVSQSPESAATHFVLGVVQRRRGDLAAARSEWSRALELDPPFVPARLALGHEELRHGDAQMAEEHAALVLRDEPANLRALCLFARVLLRQKRYESAASIAHRAVAADGGAAEPRVVQGEIALAQGNPGEALLAYEQAVLLDPHSQEAIDGLVRVYRSGRVTRPMIRHMESVAGREPRSAVLMEIAARLYRDRGWNPDAERAFQQALAIDRQRSTAATELARTYAASGALPEAQRSLALSGGEPAILLRALEAEQRQDTPAAIRHYETAVRHGERSGIAANNLAWLYAQQRTNLDRALQLAEQAIALAPYNPRVLDTLGFVRLQRREYTEAVNTLKKAFELARLPQPRRGSDPQLVAELRSHLAEAYRRSGQPQEADALPRE
jgi:cellulose synthase operon protein C